MLELAGLVAWDDDRGSRRGDRSRGAEDDRDKRAIPDGKMLLEATTTWDTKNGTRGRVAGT